ncbi:hypothetical protein [Kribbella capetownensis]|uniref:hypothetical protein n=1 Tax=Kribbella capetownensis TaxID=1572659 RepID=UPI001EE0EF20|nr:hypothetical protein [Kribbella capetownensis]
MVEELCAGELAEGEGGTVEGVVALAGYGGEDLLDFSVERGEGVCVRVLDVGSVARQDISLWVRIERVDDPAG